MFQSQISLLNPSPSTPSPSFCSGSEDGRVVVEGLVVCRNHEACSTNDTVICYSHSMVDARTRRYSVEIANRWTFDATANLEQIVVTDSHHFFVAIDYYGGLLDDAT